MPARSAPLSQRRAAATIITTLPRQSALRPWIVQSVDTTPRDAPVGVAPFINQIAVLPLVSRQRMSLMPSPLKSPVSTMDQLVGTVPTNAPPVGVAPLMNQIATLPLVSRQRRSLLPSPLKSPVPTMLQLVGTEPTVPPPMVVAPF